MRKVFLDDLPKRYKNSTNKCAINWTESVGYIVNFIYDDIIGKIKIIDYNKNKRSLHISFNENEICISSSNFIYCKIGQLLGTHSTKYKYNTNQILYNNLKITKKVILPKGKSTEKGYEYECLICGNKDKISEYNLNKGNGCNVCSGKKVLKGYNDLWTTHPHIAQLLKYPNIGYKTTKGCNNKELFKCYECGYEKTMRVYSVVNQGFGCNMCSDGISYPEKFITCLLTQLNIKFISQLTKTTYKWCDKYKYDFYIYKINGILETHGLQHYKDNNGNWSKLIDIQENDRIKEKLAKNNSINNYIVLDCRKSELTWIKNNIMERNINNPSQPCLAELLNFKEEDIDWLKCQEYACKSLVKETCNLWNKGIENTKEIAALIGLQYSSIIKYLKQGNVLGWCNYNPKQIMINNGYISSQKRKVKIICLNTMEIFNSIKEAEEYFKTKTIWNCINKKKKSAGKHPDTGEPLRWMYFEDYMNDNIIRED